MTVCPLDQRPEHKGSGPEGEVQAAHPEEGEGFCRCHPPISPRLKAQGLNGSASQPQICEKRGY